jgi:dolichyl-phosphate-mannose-protein mannosyltransferase
MKVSTRSPTTATVDNQLASERGGWRGWYFRGGRTWVVRLITVLPLLAVFALFIATALRGVNFGFHWDEQEFHVDPARKMVETGVLLPKSYIYPSFDKWLVLVPAVGRGISAAIASSGQAAAIQAAMLALIDAGDYLLRVRALFILVSSLTILWTYGAALALRQRPWQAFVAACSVSLSWEFAYHSRWAVTDCVLVQFTALTLFMLALYQRTGKPRWIYAASVAAGLTTGTKYTGVLVLFAVVVASALSLPRKAYIAQIRRAVVLCLIAFGVYLCTTPGTLLDPIKFTADTKLISSYYANNPHAGHTVRPGFHHAWVAFSYLCFSLFSGHQWLSVPMFAFAVVGAVFWVKRDKRFAAILVGFPLLFLAMFCTRFRLMLARNYLFLLPFLALMLARGLGEFERWLPKRELRWLFTAVLLAVLGVQVAWQISASESIRNVDPDHDVREALDYVRRHADTQFRVSSQVRSRAEAQHLALPANVVNAPAGTDVLFFAIAEGPGSWYFQTNDPWLTKAVFGPREVNLDWYAGWMGHDHLLVMSLDKARATGVPLAR